jgi:hypothetical protein
MPEKQPPGVAAHLCESCTAGQLVSRGAICQRGCDDDVFAEKVERAGFQPRHKPHRFTGAFGPGIAGRPPGEGRNAL